MTLEIRLYTELVDGSGNNDGFKDAKQALRDEHLGKDADSEIQLNHRRPEVQFIEKSIELIADRGQSKARILTSLLLLEMCAIAKEYSESIFDAIKPNSHTRVGSKLLSHGSGYFRSLLGVLGITDETILEFEEVESLLETAKQFIISQVYVGADSAKGFIYDDTDGKEGHPYANIEKLNISFYLTVCVDVMHDCAVKAVARNKEELDKRIQAKQQADYEKQPGIFTKIGSFPFIGNWGEKKLGLDEVDVLNDHQLGHS